MASPIWELVSRFGRSTVASPSTSSDSVTTGRREPGIYPPISWLHIRWTLGCFPDRLSATRSGILARTS